jgi:hypothetical protein
MPKPARLSDGSVVAFPDHLTDEEVAERVRSHAELAAIGISRSPHAVPTKLDPALPMMLPQYARQDWEEPSPPRPEPTFGQAYVHRKAASQREAFARVYGRHLGRRSVR